jgi:hypothetical protein
MVYLCPLSNHNPLFRDIPKQYSFTRATYYLLWFEVLEWYHLFLERSYASSSGFGPYQNRRPTSILHRICKHQLSLCCQPCTSTSIIRAVSRDDWGISKVDYSRESTERIRLRIKVSYWLFYSRIWENKYTRLGLMRSILLMDWEGLWIRGWAGCGF